MMEKIISLHNGGREKERTALSSSGTFTRLPFLPTSREVAIGGGSSPHQVRRRPAGQHAHRHFRPRYAWGASSCSPKSLSSLWGPCSLPSSPPRLAPVGGLPPPAYRIPRIAYCLPPTISRGAVPLHWCAAVMRFWCSAVQLWLCLVRL